MRISIEPNRNPGLGGPRTFREAFIDAMRQLDIEVASSPRDVRSDAILLINASRRWHKMLGARHRGIPIVQRLGAPGGALARFLKASARATAYKDHLHIRLARRLLPAHIVYQSKHARDRWLALYGPVRNCQTSVITNPAPIVDQRCPSWNGTGPLKLLSVEGCQDNDPFDIARRVSEALKEHDVGHKITMVGRTQQGPRSDGTLEYVGAVDQHEVRRCLSTHHGFLSTDILEAGCPNSALEAMAFGMPVFGYRLGPLPELLPAGSRTLVQPIGDPWAGASPGAFDRLATIIESTMKNDSRKTMQAHARTAHSPRQMALKYLQVFESVAVSESRT